MPLIKTTNTFVYYTDPSHLERIKQKARMKDLPDLSDYHFWEMCPIKLHISMSAEDFVVHREKIVACLEKYLQPKVLFEFKYVSDYLLVAKSALKMYGFAKFEHAILNYVNNRHDEYALAEVQNIFEKFKLELSPFLKKSDYRNQKLQELRDLKKEHLRFLYGDQFTLYIPADYDVKKIYEMCIDIQQLMDKHKINAGNKSDTACVLTEHINVRKEYLNEDNERIDAVLTSKSNLSKRTRSLSEIKSHELFIELSEMMKQKKEIVAEETLFEINLNSFKRNLANVKDQTSTLFSANKSRKQGNSPVWPAAPKVSPKK